MVTTINLYQIVLIWNFTPEKLNHDIFTILLEETAVFLVGTKLLHLHKLLLLFEFFFLDEGVLCTCLFGLSLSGSGFLLLICHLILRFN
jgi:hypothetical protein